MHGWGLNGSHSKSNLLKYNGFGTCTHHQLMWLSPWEVEQILFCYSMFQGLVSGLMWRSFCKVGGMDPKLTLLVITWRRYLILYYRVRSLPFHSWLNTPLWYLLLDCTLFGLLALNQWRIPLASSACTLNSWAGCTFLGLSPVFCTTC